MRDSNLREGVLCFRDLDLERSVCESIGRLGVEGGCGFGVGGLEGEGVGLGWGFGVEGVG